MTRFAQSISGLRGFATRCAHDTRGVGAVEFALILPLMLTLFFGVLEISNGVAADRKVTRVSRTLADITAQYDKDTYKLKSTELQNIFTVSGAIISPYPAAALNVTVSQVYIDANSVAKITWSKSATISQSGGQTTAVLKDSARRTGNIVTLDTNLIVKNTYLIWSEVSYNYVPVVGYVMAKAGLTLTDATFTRPRQSECIPYTEGNQTLGTC